MPCLTTSPSASRWDTRHAAGGATYGEQTVTNACAGTDAVYIRKKQPDIFEQGGTYYRRKGDKYYQITNFIVDPIEMITAEDEAQLTCDLVTESGERFRQTFMPSDFSTLPKLKGVLNKKTIALSFLGGEGDLELFKIFLYTLHWQKKKGVKALGIYPRNRKLVFVDIKGAVGVGGKAVSDIVQMERYKSLESNILSADFLDLPNLSLVGQHILSYNEPAKTKNRYSHAVCINQSKLFCAKRYCHHFTVSNTDAALVFSRPANFRTESCHE